MSKESPNVVTKWLLTVGLWGSFLCHGYSQESLTTTQYRSVGLFRYAAILVLLQSVSNCLVAIIAGIVTGNPVRLGSYRKWILPSGAYFCAHTSSLMALKYVTYQMQVLLKSCKPIPVMMGEFFIAKIRPSREKALSVILMCVGVMVFTISAKESGDHKHRDSQGTSTPILSTSNILYGVAMSVLALAADAIYGPTITKLQGESENLKAFDLMLNMNVYQFVVAVAYMAFFDRDTVSMAAVYFSKAEMDFYFGLALYLIAMGVGTVFIFALQWRFGALEVSKTTNMRKLISVLLSSLFFGRPMSFVQILSVFVVFLSGPIAGALVGKEGAKSLPKTRSAHTVKSNSKESIMI